MKILLVGPQGSGKSTQAALLAEYLQLPKISTGDIFRELAVEQSDEGKRIKEILNSGALIDDRETAEIVQKRLFRNDCRNGFILDGYPRNIEQKELFDPQVEKVVFLDVPDEEVVRRLMARKREDDTLEAIQKRLNLYHEHTKPLLNYYKEQGMLIEVNGQGSIEEIQDKIRKQLSV